MKEKFRVTQSKDEIVSVFRDAMNNNFPMDVWQTIDGKRVVTYGRISYVDESVIRLEFSSKEGPLPQISKNTKLYLHSNYKNFLFKQDILEIKSGVVELRLPHELWVHELRKYPRYYLNDNTPKYMELWDTHFRGGENFKAKILDLSRGGAGLVVDEELFFDITKGQRFLVVDITDHENVIPAHLEMQVQHKRSVKDGDHWKYYLGIQFLEELDQVVYFKVQDSAPVSQDTSHHKVFMGYPEEERFSILKRIEIKDRDLYKNITDNIEILTPLKFMTPQMKGVFFREVQIHVLAGALRLMPQEFIHILCEGLSTRLLEDFIFELSQSRSVGVVKKCQDEMIKVMKELERQNKLLLDKTGFKRMV